MAEGIKVGSVDDIAPGEAIRIDEERTGTGDGIAVFNDDGAFYALDDTCSHQKASLAEGWIEDGEVECPLHAASFSLQTGKALCLPATQPVNVHRVEVVDDEIWLYPGEAPA